MPTIVEARPEIIPLPENINYGVSRDGRVWSRYLVGQRGLAGDWREMKCKAFHGYKFVSYYIAGRARKIPVHRLVAKTLLGPSPMPNMHVAHYDGNPLNNAIENLRWATVRENAMDKLRHGTMRMGTAINTARLSEGDVIRLRKMIRYGLSDATLSIEFGITRRAVWAVRKGESWKHISA